MSHEINTPYDRVFSTKSTEWHGLAEVVPAISDETIAPLLFPIVEGKIVAKVDGAEVEMGAHKALIADLRHREDLSELERLQPLHIPKNSYTVIENRAVWEMMKKACADTGLIPTSAGTLGTCKKFFLTVEIPGESEFKVNNDDFRAYLNFATSHDGTLALTAWDSFIRVVCANTLKASHAEDKNICFKTYHSAGASMAIDNIADILSQIIAGRAIFRDNMEYLASVEISPADAYKVALGYLISANPSGDKMRDNQTISRRTLNAAASITALYSRGKGNNGKSLYDLLNGATEYWTSGEGVGKGKGTSLFKKISKSEFGGAAEHKARFCNALVAGEENVKSLKELGAEAVTWKITGQE